MTALDDGETVALGAPKQRALLVALLLGDGAVSRSQLVSAIWGEDPPASAAQSLQVYVHNLRRALGAERIETHGTGYRLVHRPDELDLTRFERLLERGRAALDEGRGAAAADDLRRALALWRGAPLADLADEPVAAVDAGRLENLRRSAQEALVDAELALGRHADVLDDLERLTAGEPYRERLWEQRLLALYRCGRQTDALALYRRLRRTFSEELGLEFGPALQELERRMLRQDPLLDPPARTAFGTARLPRPPTPLLGRRLELAAVAALLRRDDVALVTLTGPGGTGKTRLAVAVAAELASQLPDGAVFVDLAPVSDAAYLTATIATALGLEPSDASQASVLEHLRERATLLVLDNLEQLLPEAATVVAELMGAPQLRLLTTSRAPLRVTGEHEYPVPPLTLPTPGTPEHIAANDAVQLFGARAAAVEPSFAVDAGNAEAVAEICRRLDGLPLAIELAAARTKLLTPQALAARLGSSLALLTGGARDLPERQQTLRATLDWSYDLLEPEERTLLAQLSVFPSAFDLEAAAAVAGGEIMDTLASLVDKSLVTRADASRFALLATIRAYASERLDEQDGAAEARRRHGMHFLELAEAAEPTLSGGSEDLPQVLDRLDRTHDDLRSALVWAAEVGDVETEVRLVVALRQFWMVRGELAEGSAFFAHAIAHTAGGEPRLCGLALAHGGVFAYRRGELEQARAIYEEALGIFRSLGDLDEVARCLAELGSVYFADGDLDTAIGLYEEAAALFRGLGQQARLSMTLSNLGALAGMRGDHELAATHGEEAARIQRDVDDRDALSITLHNLGRTRVRLGDVARGRAHLAESYTIARSLGYREVLAYCLTAAAQLSVRSGDAEDAARLLGASQAAFDALGLGIPEDERETHRELAEALVRALGRERAEELGGEGRLLAAEPALEAAFFQPPTRG